MSLPANLILAKNQIDCKYPWLLLLEFTLYPGEEGEITHRFARNFENVTFKGQVYPAFNFQVGLVEESSDGKIPTTSLGVSNVTQFLQPLLEEEDGAVDAVVKITIVHADLLAEDYSELELSFDVLSPHLDANMIIFRLGAPSPLRQRFPLYRYFADLCPSTFKSARCGYTGDDTYCNHCWKDCIAKENTARFGGTPGIET